MGTRGEIEGTSWGPSGDRPVRYPTISVRRKSVVGTAAPVAVRPVLGPVRGRRLPQIREQPRRSPPRSRTVPPRPRTHPRNVSHRPTLASVRPDRSACGTLFVACDRFGGVHSWDATTSGHGCTYPVGYWYMYAPEISDSAGDVFHNSPRVRCTSVILRNRGGAGVKSPQRCES